MVGEVRNKTVIEKTPLRRFFVSGSFKLVYFFVRDGRIGQK